MPDDRADIATAEPTVQGFTREGLAELNARMHALVDEKRLANVVTLVARHGKVVDLDAYGVLDVSADPPVPVRADTIFRIASMTKPIIGAAMMMLWEEGKWTLDDPVAKHIPQFEGLKVRRKDGDPVAQDRPMTMAQLMSHTAGFGRAGEYGDLNLRGGDLQDMIDALATRPLSYQPGRDWRYGPSVDIQGYVIEKMSGMGLDAFLEQRLFAPLGMSDTGFWVDPAKGASRLPHPHLRRRRRDHRRGRRQSDEHQQAQKFLSGGGGLVSKIEDYWRFCQMILNRGELDGKRYLKPETVDLMHVSVLESDVNVTLYSPEMRGLGFGMDFAIIEDPAAAKTNQGVQSFYWGGAYGTWFWIDPVNDMIVIGMIQNQGGSQTAAGNPAVREMSAVDGVCRHDRPRGLRRMETVRLGRTGLEVSVAGLGCGGHSRLGMARGKDVHHAADMVRRALDLGINYIDTARAYGTEEAVGLGLKGPARRGGGLDQGRRGPRRRRADQRRRHGALHRREPRQARHRPHRRLPAARPAGLRDYAYAVDALLPELKRAKQASGKIRFIAASEQFGGDTTHAFLQAALPDDHFDVLMVGFSLLNPSARQRVFPQTISHDVGTLIMFAVREALSRPEELRKVVGELIARGEVDAASVDASDPLGFLGVPVVEAAYRYCRHEPGAHVILTGTGDPEHLKANIASILAPPLPPRRPEAPGHDLRPRGQRLGGGTGIGKLDRNVPAALPDIGAGRPRSRTSSPSRRRGSGTSGGLAPARRGFQLGCGPSGTRGAGSRG